MSERLRGWLAELQPVRPHLIWLVFLVIPAYFLVTVASPWWADALGWLALILHALLFVAAMHTIARAYYPGPELDPTSDTQKAPRTDWRVAGVILALQAVATALAIPALDVGAAPLASYAVATVIFLSPIAVGVVAGTLISAGLLAAVTLRVSVDVAWAWAPTVWTAVVLMITRVSLSGEFRAERLRLELARSETRERVASDVHDLLGHSLSLITVKAELAKRLVRDDPDSAISELDDICGLSRGATGEVRATVRQLTAPDLAGQLELSADGMRAAGLTVTVTGQVDQVPGPQQRLAAWVVREATTNVVRHARANHCTIALSPTHLRICDDGVGPGEGHEPPRPGHGVRSMRTRADAQGANLTIAASHPGTTVELEFA